MGVLLLATSKSVPAGNTHSLREVHFNSKDTDILGTWGDVEVGVGATVKGDSHDAWSSVGGGGSRCGRKKGMS